MSQRALKVIKQLEMDLLEHVESNPEKRELLLPLTDKNSISNMLWNFSVDKKYREQINLSDFKQIIDILFSRL